MEIDAEEHHRRAQGVERMKPFSGSGVGGHRNIPLLRHWTGTLDLATLLRKVPCYTDYEGGITVSESLLVQLRKGVLDMCVLALLARQDGYAYDIASRLAEAIGMGEGTIYPLMRRMQTDGLVTTYLEESSSGPPRKYYQLTKPAPPPLLDQTPAWKPSTHSFPL